MTSLTMEEVATGLRKDEFLLHYQPKVSLTTSRIIGAEALARWRRQDGTVLRPAAFMPVAERGALLGQLTRSLLHILLRDLDGMRLDAGLCISFNVSADDLQEDGLTDLILDKIARKTLSPLAIELEITETQALSCGKRVLAHMHALAEAGVGLAMDDYGIGYSSIDTLSQWPFSTIKLDQGIVGRMLTSEKNATIVRSTLRLGHELGLNVVAEGVETIAQHDFLVDAGCKIIQGYLVSHPLPLDEFKAFRQNTSAGSILPIGLVYMAIVDHVQWRRQMVIFAIQRSALPPGSPLRRAGGHPELCATRCALGKWYNGDGRSFGDTTLYEAIDPPHRHLHAIGTEIVERIHGGAGLRQVVPLLHQLKNVSACLIHVLEHLEDDGLEALYGAVPSRARDGTED